MCQSNLFHAFVLVKLKRFQYFLIKVSKNIKNDDKITVGDNMNLENSKTPKTKPKELKKGKRKLWLWIGIIIIVLIAIIALTIILWPKKEDSSSNNDQSKETEDKTEPEQIQKKLTIVDEDSNERPIAIMIDNNVGNTSHQGLQNSYLNYELIVEGGLTRIMAIFKDQDLTSIGPVRSSRHSFLDYALESDCIYVHYGWSPYAQNDIQALNVDNINGLYDSEPFWRTTTLAAPHNVFTSIEKIYAYAQSKSYPITTTNWKLLNYNPESVNLNEPIGQEEVIDEATGKTTKKDITNPELLLANSVSIPYSYYQTRSYTYDASRQVYLRFMNGNPHLDSSTQQQLYYKNIIIEKVVNHILDSEGRQDLDTVGTGTGYYIANGYALPITWTKESRNAKTKYTYSDGKEIEVNDGNTFIQIVPETSTITIE